MHTTLVSIIGIMVIFFCCGGLPLISPENLVTERLSKKEVTGTYRFVNQKVIRDDTNNYSTAKIKLYEDDTCELIKFPVFIENDGKYQLEKLFTGECMWEMKPLYDGGQFFGICFDAVDFNSAEQCATLVKSDTSYALVFIFDDPDSGNNISFRKDVSG